MNNTKILLKKCAPVFMAVAGCSLFSQCDSSGNFTPNGGSPGSNLNAIASPITDARLLDFMEFETTSGTSSFRFLDFSNVQSGTLNNNPGFNLAGGNNAASLETRQTVNVRFTYLTRGDNTFVLEDVTSGIFEQQFTEHVNGIYGSQQFGFNSITRNITLNHDIDNFTLAEIIQIADEFNGYTAATAMNVPAGSTGDIISVDLPSATLYSPSSEEYRFTITSTNAERLVGIIRGTFERDIQGRPIAFRRPLASEVGDSGTFRLDPGHLVPFISDTIRSFGTAEIGTFELTLVAGN